MELTKNKIIFFAAAGLFVVIMLFFLLLSSSGNGRKKIGGNGSNEFVIWTVLPEWKNSYELIEDFKKSVPKYKSRNIRIENFSNYETYSYALLSAFASDKAPSIFMLNNNETSVFSDMTMAVNPRSISVADFRKYYKVVFGEDLILKDKQGEFLAGIPVGYESLGIFYNKRFVKSSDLRTLSALNSSIFRLKSKYGASIPFAIGNGGTVEYSGDIATQFMLLLDGGTSINTIKSNQLKTGLMSYLNYGYENRGNEFNARYKTLASEGKDGSYLLAKNTSFMVAGYPRLIEKIEKYGGVMGKFLSVEPFPYYTPGKGKTLVNYNYFVINKYTQHTQFANDFMSYIASEKGQKKIMQTYPYYLPASIAFDEDLGDVKIHKDYNITLKDFSGNINNLTSFNKGIKNIYDQQMKVVLDLGDSYRDAFIQLQNKLSCMTKKVLTLTNLSSACK